MTKQITLRQRLQYAFDNTLSSGSSAIIAWLAVLSSILVIVFGLVYTFTGSNMPDQDGMGFFEAMWQALMRSVDPGTVAGDEGWGFRLLGVLITIGGIFILSTLIGVLTAGLEDKLDELRKGRSLVLEKNHTLILGWSDKIFHIIEQLIIANASEKRSHIVILADRDKVEMEDELLAHIPDRHSTRLICRHGSPLNTDDIAIVSPDEAKSIIVLSPEQEENPDIYVIKSVLALTNNPDRKAEPYHIVAEIDDNDNMEAAHLVGGKEASYIRSSSLLARIAAQTCRQSGLSMIYSDLLDYRGDEIYFQHEPRLEGKTYQQALFSYDTSSVIGMQRNNGDVLLNPPMDSVFESGDTVIVIAQDDSTIRFSGGQPPQSNDPAMTVRNAKTTGPETNIIIGWNPKGAKVIRELDHYVESGSQLIIVAPHSDLDTALSTLQESLSNQHVKLIREDSTRRAALDKIDFSNSRNIILLTSDTLPTQGADANTLITLLHLRNIATSQNLHFNIVSEMGDIKNRELAEVARADDFIIGDHLVSRLLAQLSETRELKAVFDELFDADGAEIYLCPAENYIAPGRSIRYIDLLEAAARRGETCIGYRLAEHARDGGKNYGIHINPRLNDSLTLNVDDRIVVLSHDG
ncbi:MAG: CASTOR/POLLUX-related putative ion channel [Parahaliea sp.]